jgi:hypothetical protein
MDVYSCENHLVKGIVRFWNFLSFFLLKASPSKTEAPPWGKHGTRDLQPTRDYTHSQITASTLFNDQLAVSACLKPRISLLVRSVTDTSLQEAPKPHHHDHKIGVASHGRSSGRSCESTCAYLKPFGDGLALDLFFYFM